MPRMMGRMFMNGDGDSGGFYSRQLGRRFHSEKEMIAYAESQGLVPVSGNDKAWTDIKENNREANDVEAQARGFRDSEHQAADIKKHSRDYLATARQKKIDAHHEVHGNEGRQTIEEAFGDL